MWKAALAGAFGLAVGMNSLATAQEVAAYESYEAGAAGSSSSGSSGPVVTEAHIGRLRSSLRLTPEQHAHWAPVESALRALSRQQRQEGAGFVSRMRDRASAMASAAVQMRRLTAVSGPLINSLDEQQKQRGMALIRRFGFERLMASY